MDATPQSLVPSAFDEEQPVAVSAEIAEPVAAAVAPVALANSALSDIPVKVEAVLGGASMRVDALLATGPGSVIELDRKVGEPVDLIVNGRLLARGELVLVDGLLGVTLTEIVKGEG